MDRLRVAPASKRPLKLDRAFAVVYRRGRWVRGANLSVGASPNGTPLTRIGLRVRREIRRAVDRNRLKRQLRAILFSRQYTIAPGVDLVVVAHPKGAAMSSVALAEELTTLCRKQRVFERGGSSNP